MIEALIISFLELVCLSTNFEICMCGCVQCMSWIPHYKLGRKFHVGNHGSEEESSVVWVLYIHQRFPKYWTLPLEVSTYSFMCFLMIYLPLRPLLKGRINHHHTGKTCAWKIQRSFPRILSHSSHKIPNYALLQILSKSVEILSVPIKCVVIWTVIIRILIIKSRSLYIYLILELQYPL